MFDTGYVIRKRDIFVKMSIFLFLLIISTAQITGQESEPGEVKTGKPTRTFLQLRKAVYDDILTFAVEHSEKWVKLVNTDTGKLKMKELSSGSYTEYHNLMRYSVCVVLYALYSVDHPKNTCRGKKKFLEAAWKCGEYALRDRRSKDAWLSCALSEVYRRSKHLMTEKQRAFWLNKLKDVWAQNKRHSGKTHNIPAWHMISLYNGAIAQDNESAKNIAAGFMNRLSRAQKPDGYWREGTGPTIVYNHLYIQALGMYYLLSGDKRVEPAFVRAGRYHSYFMYPDGSCIGLISGRIGYRPLRSTMGFPGLDLTAEGQGYLRDWYTQSKRQQLGEPGTNGFMFLGAALLYSGAACKITPIGTYAQDWKPQHLPVHKISSGPWVVFLSGITGRRGSRWHMERSVCVSVWNSHSGLLCGGQLSRSQPAWSNFKFSDSPEGYCAERGGIKTTQHLTSLHLKYKGGNQGWIRVNRPTGKKALVLEYGIKSEKTATAGLTFYIHYPQPLKRKQGRLDRPPKGESRTWTAKELGGVLEHEGVRISLPEDATFQWPFPLYNPYHSEGKLTSYDDKPGHKCLENYALLSFPIQSGKPVRIIFQCHLSHQEGRGDDSVAE